MKLIITKIMTFFKNYKDFVCLVVMNLILEFLILKKLKGIPNQKHRKIQKNPPLTKFSSIIDLLNEFILDGIIGNCKQSELPLMHQNLENIQELIPP